jgi:chromosome segregation ATPase
MTGSRDLAQKAFELMQEALRESEARISALDAELKRRHVPRTRPEEQIEVLTHRLESTEAEAERWRREAGHLEEVAETERAKVRQLKKRLEIAESGPDKLTRQELNYWRARIDTIGSESQEYKNRIAALRTDLKARENELTLALARAERAEAERRALTDDSAARHARQQQLEQELATTREHSARLEPKFEQAHARIRTLTADVENAERRIAELTPELESARARIAQVMPELEAARERIATLVAELDGVRARNTALEREMSDAHEEAAATRLALDQSNGRLAELERDLDAAKQATGSLEAELHEQREHVDNLTELSNERKERITRLEEQVEEAQERYEDARWKLSKAEYFERIVKRRRRLIASLLDALRAKQKANTALKAGVDSLRTYKATAEQNQHKLLARIDHLMARLSEAEAASDRHAEKQARAPDSAADPNLTPRIAELEQRLHTQTELIQSLEADLKGAKSQLREQEAAATAMERLRNELEMKNEVIARLQSDADERERKLARLRGSDSETLRLKAEIAKLEESVSSWKKRYEFLSTEEPNPYKAAAEK